MTALLCLIAGQTCAAIAINVGPTSVKQVLSACGRTWLLDGGGIMEGGRAFILRGRKAVRLQGIDGQVASIKEIQGQCWILTSVQERSPRGTSMSPSGLFLFDGTKARRIGDTGIQVGRVVEANGKTFFLSELPYKSNVPGKIFVRFGDDLRPFSRKLDGHAAGVVAAAGKTWILTTELVIHSQTTSSADGDSDKKYQQGPAYLVDGDDATLFGPGDFRVEAVRESGDYAILIGHDKAGAAALRARAGTFSMIRLGAGKATWSKMAGADLVVATTNGKNHALHLIRADGSVVHLPEVTTIVRDAADLGDDRWLLWGGRMSMGDALPAYVLKGAQVSKLELPDGQQLRRVEKAGGKNWLLLSKGVEPGPLYLFEDGSVKPFGKSRFRARDVEAASDRIWAIDHADRVHEIVGDEANESSALAFPVEDVARAGNCVWFVPKEARDSEDANVSRQVWRQCGSATKPQEFPNSIRVRRVADINGTAWLLTRVGEIGSTSDGPAFYVDNELEARLEFLHGAGAPWLQSAVSRIWPGVWIAGPVGVGAAYFSKASSSEPGNDGIAPRFRVVLAGTQMDLDARIAGDRWISVSDASYEVPLGRSNIFATLQDEWGNRGPKTSYGAVAVPGSATLGTFTASAWVLLIVATVFAAPWFAYANTLVMNPVIRGVGSFGLVPIILSTVPAARRHLLRRYGKGIQQSREIAFWRDRFIPPAPKFTSGNVDQLLQDSSTVLMLGRSGVGKTTYFKYLAAAGKSGSKRQTVWIPLARYFPAQKNVEDMFHLQLSGIGGISDPAISKIFLSHGGFLILIDGLNEVDAETRSNVRAFIDGSGRRNQIIVSSQERYREMDGIESVDVPLLRAPEIRKLFAFELGEDAAAVLIGSLADSELRIFETPQIAWLSCQMARAVHRLPRTELELYQSLFEPIFDAWKSDGNSNAQMLCRFAFEMLYEDKPSFNLAAGDLPPAVVTWLTQQGFVRRTDELVIFRHDTIRDYLASRHLADQWRHLPKSAEPVKAWLPAIRLTLLGLSSAWDRGEFLGWLLRRNPDVAQLAYRDWKSYSNDAEVWEEQFVSEFGRALLKSSPGEGQA